MMKKFTKIFAVVALFTAMTTVSAKAQVYYGVKAGTNLTSTSIKIADSKDIQLSKDSGDYGFQAGVVVGSKVPILGVGIEAEGLWVYNKIDFGMSGKVHSNSFEVPIMAVIPVPIVPISVKVGPSFMLGSRTKVEDVLGNDLKLGPIKSSVGYTIGLGIKVAQITADLRFNGQFKSHRPFEKIADLVPDLGGLGDIVVENTLSEYNLHTNTFSLSLGYRF